MDLENKRVVITGANGNLGQAVAQTALSRGAKLVLVDIGFDSALPAYPPECSQQLALDLLDTDATQKALQSIGPVDALCNVAGGFAMGTPVHETPDEDWSRMYDLNVRTLLNTQRALVPGMLERRRGAIVNVAAAGALAGDALMAPYAAAKSTVMRITESSSRELKAQGINVNCVTPSIIDTPQNREAMPDADTATWVSPEQLASVICFLLSESANAIHGASVPVTGLV